MAEILEKLRPDRDLQCYFLQPSAVAAFSQTSASGFTLSGTWRQQFDWAVVEWNRDNVFEHPMFRSFPDGDLSGLTLTYDETRQNCIVIDSDLYPTVDWPNLRIWADDGTGEKVYRIPLMSCAAAIEGSYAPATAVFTLSGTAGVGDYAGFAFLDEHYTYQFNSGDTFATALSTLVAAINKWSPTMEASNDGSTITLASRKASINANRIGVYTYVQGASMQWDAPWKLLAGGQSPTKWRFTIPFGSLKDDQLGKVPAQAIRKVRWTYSADLQSGEFCRSEFQVAVSNWNVTGSGRTYSIAGPGSRRVEDSSKQLVYQGSWISSKGNFSSGTIQCSTKPNSAVTASYFSAQQHSLYLGTRLGEKCTSITAQVDTRPALNFNLVLAGEDVLVRKLLGTFGPGQHCVTATHAGTAGQAFYFDFFEIAIPCTSVPAIPATEPGMTLATDWDTEHSLALAPERTAWMINSLGFTGRVNHYAGALWFYELVRVGHTYASASVTFQGTPDPNVLTQLFIGRTDQPNIPPSALSHLNLLTDTAENLAKAFELLINGGYTAIRAEAAGNRLTIYSRSMGDDGNYISIGASAPTQHLTVVVSSPTLTGGVDGTWCTDLQATPRLNRAARDWSTSFYVALKNCGLDVTTAFSMELGNGDVSAEAGIAQRYPNQNPVWLDTPSLQTNFSPVSAAFWEQVYSGMAQIQAAAGLTPYLQFGEVQWWYFPDGKSGMPFYDAYTTQTFRAKYGYDLAVIKTNTVDPQTVADEANFLPSLIGAFTSRIRDYVRASNPNCRFEVLYPTDVNNTALNRVINYAATDWTPSNLDCLKTESFSFTYERDLNAAKTGMCVGQQYGFRPSQRSHLVGVGDCTTAWLKEARTATCQGFPSVVLFALDQFCLIGYALPLSKGQRRSLRVG